MYVDGRVLENIHHSLPTFLGKAIVLCSQESTLHSLPISPLSKTKITQNQTNIELEKKKILFFSHKAFKEVLGIGNLQQVTFKFVEIRQMV